MIKIWGKVFLWILPFLISGIAAPFLFSSIENRKTAGHYAGALFIFSGIWFVLVSFRHSYSFYVRALAGVFFLLSLLFWSWRFQTEKPLADSRLLNLSGDLWHHGLTDIYFVCLCTFVYSEFARLRKV